MGSGATVIFVPDGRGFLPTVQRTSKDLRILGTRLSLVLASLQGKRLTIELEGFATGLDPHETATYRCELAGEPGTLLVGRDADAYLASLKTLKP